jgi:hypothetical protein
VKASALPEDTHMEEQLRVSEQKILQIFKGKCKLKRAPDQVGQV